MMVPLHDVIGRDRPMTYVIRGGEFRVRPREGELGEASKVVRALAKKVKKPNVPKVPEPPKAAIDKIDQEPDVSAAKKRAQAAVSAAAAERTRERSAQEKRAATIAKKRSDAAKGERAATSARRMADRKAQVKKVRERVATKSAARANDKAGQINAQLAHCILALHFKRNKSVRGAWNICRASLTKTGYMKPPYREGGKLDSVKPTQKGAKRAMQHATEKHPLNGGIRGTPDEKFKKFRNLFRQIEPTV